MKAGDVFLIMLDHSGGKISGKTMIQKQGYFLDLYLDLGLNYHAHYYGPYSPSMDSAIGDYKALGFVGEKVTDYGFNKNGFEMKRFVYELTDDGRTIVELIRKENPEIVKEINRYLDQLKSAGNLDYMELSIAAKSHFILKSESKATTRHEVVQKAKGFNWDISEENVEKAINFLTAMELVNSYNLR